MTISRKGARAKGLNYQAELAKRWRDSGLFPQAQSGIAQARKGTEQPDITGADRFWIECKFNKVATAHAALKQAEENADGKRKVPAWFEAWGNTAPIPVAICKQNRSGEIVVMRMETFEHLVKLAQAVHAKEVEA